MELSDSTGADWAGAQWRLRAPAAAEPVASGTLRARGSAHAPLCVPAGCYVLSALGGAHDQSLGWTLTQPAAEGAGGAAAGPRAVVASGGATFGRRVCLTATGSAGGGGAPGRVARVTAAHAIGVAPMGAAPTDGVAAAAGMRWGIAAAALLLLAPALVGSTRAAYLAGRRLRAAIDRRSRPRGHGAGSAHLSPRAAML